MLSLFWLRVEILLQAGLSVAATSQEYSRQCNQNSLEQPGATWLNANTARFRSLRQELDQQQIWQDQIEFEQEGVRATIDGTNKEHEELRTMIMRKLREVEAAEIERVLKRKHRVWPIVIP
jgi:hypothetical protein